jgi:type 1 glutamine amidotransferase
MLAVLGAALLAGEARACLAKKRVLFFTKSAGFEHSVIKRNGSELSHAERILKDVAGDKYEVICSKDGSLFEPDKIGQFDAFVFYTTGDLSKPGTDGQPPLTASGEKALLEAIRGGKGYIGIHCATDTFGAHRGKGAEDPYTRLVGGQFNGHGAQQPGKIVVNDLKFPGAGAFGPEFVMTEEWYSQKCQPEDLHVIMYHVTEGMKGDDYKRPNFPMTWARMEGKGRSFYTSMGHREDTWENPKFQGLLVHALDWVTGAADADVTPNASEVTPQYQTLEPR